MYALHHHDARNDALRASLAYPVRFTLRVSKVSWGRWGDSNLLHFLQLLRSERTCSIVYGVPLRARLPPVLHECEHRFSLKITLDVYMLAKTWTGKAGREKVRDVHVKCGARSVRHSQPSRGTSN